MYESVTQKWLLIYINLTLAWHRSQLTHLFNSEETWKTPPWCDNAGELGPTGRWFDYFLYYQLISVLCQTHHSIRWFWTHNTEIRRLQRQVREDHKLRAVDQCTVAMNLFCKKDQFEKRLDNQDRSFWQTVPKVCTSPKHKLCKLSSVTFVYVLPS